MFENAKQSGTTTSTADFTGGCAAVPRVCVPAFLLFSVLSLLLP
jgi:hypothetical protein